MPRRSDAITAEELEEIKEQLILCRFSDPLREKIKKRIDAEIARREKAGKKGGRPKGQKSEPQEAPVRDGHWERDEFSQV